MKHFIVIFSLLAAFTFADAEKTPTENSTKAALVASKELIQVMGLKEQMSTGFDAMMPMIQGQADQLNLSPEQQEKLIGIYKTWFTEDLDHDRMEKSIIRIYAQTFNEKELKELIAFYKTPLGKKVLEKTPELMETSALMGMDEATKNQGKLMERLTPFLEGIQQQ